MKMTEFKVCGICSVKVCLSENTHLNIDELKSANNILQNELCWILKNSWKNRFQDKKYFCFKCTIKIKSIILIHQHLLGLIAKSFGDKYLLEEAVILQENLKSVFGKWCTESFKFSVDSILDGTNSNCLPPNAVDSGKKKIRKYENSSADVSKKEKSSQNSSALPFKCSHCFQSFEHKAHMMKHEKLHAEEKAHKCKICKKSFRYLKQLRKHKRTHSEEKDVCEKCGKEFTCRDSYYRHRKTHFRKFNCTTCEFTTDNHISLQRHEALHFVKRRYPCPHCNKAFVRNEHLTRHIRTHTGETPYKCSICDKKFAQSQDVIRHEKTHKGEEPHTCFFCSKTCASKQSLNKHVTQHHLDNDEKKETEASQVTNQGDYDILNLTLDLHQPSVSCEVLNSDINPNIVPAELASDLTVRNEPDLIRQDVLVESNMQQNFFTNFEQPVPLSCHHNSINILQLNDENQSLDLSLNSMQHGNITSHVITPEISSSVDFKVLPYNISNYSDVISNNPYTDTQNSSDLTILNQAVLPLSEQEQQEVENLTLHDNHVSDISNYIINYSLQSNQMQGVAALNSNVYVPGLN